MIQKFIIRENRPRLLLFFAGWGADESPFRTLRPERADWMICYDYRTLDFDSGPLTGYAGITLVGWSMGVWVACRTMERHPGLPVTDSLAINGTPYPIDERRGIPPAVFDGTLRHLDARRLWKFQRRICGSAEAHRDFLRTAPQRPVEELTEELSAIRRMCVEASGTPFVWSKAVVGTEDLIFPPENQRRAWAGGEAEAVEETAAPHYGEALFRQYLNAV